ncbi:nucleolin 2-like isoform X3 [Olea europaea var. sylvestris]|uniref:nucleolin 2-like isoform X3 n=1 Tax=Olea europaea var. sylvestris TaxID=158386 RepID=UPI000C1D4FC8|nr:nucleolin 2-like isoform X3 [Olea europaea var. sylvestris]
MPPKSALNWDRGSANRSTARKPTPGASREPNSTTPYNSRPPTTSAAAVTPTPPTNSPSSVERAKARTTNSAATRNDSQNPLHETFVSQPQQLNSEKTLIRCAGLMESDVDGKKDSINADAGKSIEAVGLEKPSHAEAETTVECRDGFPSDSVVPGALVLNSPMQENFSVESKARSDNGVTGGTAGPGNGKMKIVKKTVRVVKKIIKRRVPKRVLIESSENQGSVKKEENVLNLSEVTEKSNMKNYNLVNDMMENEAIDQSNLVNEVKEKSNSTNAVTEKFNIETGTRVTVPMEVGKGNDLSGIDSTETDQLKINDVIVAKLDRRDSNATISDLMEAKNVGSAAEVTLESETTKGVEGTVAKELSKDLLLEIQNAGTNEKENVELVEDQNMDPVRELGSMTFEVEQYASLVGETGSGNGNGEEGGKEMLEDNRAGLNEGFLLSGELEALERKKRRQTEIFVGGLDKETKEDDIKKVFEEAGEIVEVRLTMNKKTGKNKGFAFVQFATAADAKNALTNYSKVEICGKQCGAAPVEGNDTIFLGNINKTWKIDDIVKLLEKSGIEKIDGVTIKADPNNMKNNRGFAFVEFERPKDAQIAFHKLQKNDIFGKDLKIKVEWAQPLNEPAEEEILKVKTVYAEYLPSLWDEENVKEYFKRFGKIENVVLAKDLPASRRKDFAFINYSSREAALTCIETVNRDKEKDDSTKVKMRVSLANPIMRGRQMKHVSNPIVKKISKEKPKALKPTVKLHEPRNKGQMASSGHGGPKINGSSSTTDELMHILRQQASSTTFPEHHFPAAGSRQPYFLVGFCACSPISSCVTSSLFIHGHDPLYSESRGLPRACTESYYPISGPSSLSHGAGSVGMASFPYHHQQMPDYASASIHRRENYPSPLENFFFCRQGNKIFTMGTMAYIVDIDESI